MKAAQAEKSRAHAASTRICIDTSLSVAEICAQFQVSRTSAWRARQRGWLNPEYHARGERAPAPVREPRTNPNAGYNAVTEANLNAVETIARSIWRAYLQGHVESWRFEDYLDRVKDAALFTKCPHLQYFPWLRQLAVNVALQFRQELRRKPSLVGEVPSWDQLPDVDGVEVANPGEVLEWIREKIISTHSRHAWARVWKWANRKRAYRCPQHVQEILRCLG